MFAKLEKNQLAVSVAAKKEVECWQQMLGLRITLQKGIDIANHLPSFRVDGMISDEEDAEALDEAKISISSNLGSTLSSLVFFSGEKKRKLHLVEDLEGTWDKVYKQQRSSENKWKDVLNKWHARYHFGSEAAKSKLKVFNKSLWDQVEDIVSDDRKRMEKGRMQSQQSNRIGQEVQNKSAKDVIDYDLEVYDDRNFYSMLLKTFITSANSGGLSSMGAEDLQALRKYKKKKSNVDRKASKGRKIRYVVHTKLENFMFPVPTMSESGIDVERLHRSLFQ